MPPGGSTKPQRSCAACRKVADKKDLLRFVLAPDSQVVLDYRQQLPGRGLYTCLNRQCLSQAVKKNSFRRLGDRQQEPISLTQLQAQLQQALQQRITGLIRMARKSGQVITGSNQVLEVMKGKSPPSVIVVAVDISAGMGERIENAADRHKITLARMYDKVSLGQLIGKEERSVVAVINGPLAEALKSELDRYELVREN
ncbi:MAG: DUF448 domain-containing protein [Pelovirga sp.]